MGDIKRKVEDSKAGQLSAKKPDGIEVNWGNAEKIKILLLQAINNNILEILKLLKEAKEENK